MSVGGIGAELIQPVREVGLIDHFFTTFSPSAITTMTRDYVLAWVAELLASLGVL